MKTVILSVEGRVRTYRGLRPHLPLSEIFAYLILTTGWCRDYIYPLVTNGDTEAPGVSDLSQTTVGWCVCACTLCIIKILLCAVLNLVFRLPLCHTSSP